MPAGEDSQSAAPVTAQASRFGFLARPLGIAYVTLFALLAVGAAAIAIAGKSSDGSPVISIHLRPFPSAGEAAVMKLGAFHDTREAGGNLVADPALIEDSPQGPLPRIARDGRTPMKAYGRSFTSGGKKPRIALVLRGLGVGASKTDFALSQLPSDVTLGFVPFSPELQSEIDKARGAGHEVLLEVPMEPFDFPDSDPGPHALLVAASPEENGKRLDWTLSRATGYAGVMNLLGGRFMGEEFAIEPMLAHIAKRGLLFFDNGASSSSVAITSARHARAALATGTLTLDSVQTAGAIDSKLAELENAARQDGFAIGVASVYPVTIARLAEWTASAEARGFQLVPLSSLAALPSQPDANVGE
ncbi:MAG TPA: divergent polysaccharide deacetylase family protein [Micropepsaceae bacterium]|nr:divergent polysaccharide deacetylase family protein [Micropepsaceae bacterium]